MRKTDSHNTGAPLALQRLRRRMMEPELMTLTNRTTELVFTTARVETGGSIWSLPEDPRPLEFTYSHDQVVREAREAIERTCTDELLIIKRGRIVVECYENMTRQETHYISYSMAKSINSIMFGAALRDGLIGSEDESVDRYVPEVRGSAYEGMSIRHVLQMRSGTDWIDWFGDPGPSRDIQELAFMQNVERFYKPAFSAKAKHPVGTVFNYNTVESSLVSLIVSRAAGMPFSRYVSEKLWRPAGMESYGFYILDGVPGVGFEFTGGGFNAVLRDYGRIGQMMLNRGIANGVRILDEDFVKRSTAPASDKTTDWNPGYNYGYQWWTVDGTRQFSAIGGGGQWIFVDPDTQTVIVKLSHAPTAMSDFKPVADETLAFFQAACAWAPV